MSDPGKLTNWYSLVPVFAITIAIGGLYADKLNSESKNIYHHPDIALQFEYSNDWTLARTEFLDKLIIAGNPSVKITMDNFNNYKISYKVAHQKFNEVTYNNFFKISAKDITIHDISAFQLDFHYSLKENDQEEVIRVRQILIPGVKNLIAITFSAPEYYFKEYLQTFKELCASIKIQNNKFK